MFGRGRAGNNMRIIFKTIKYILLAAMAIMLGALIYLLWTERDPSAVRSLAWSEEAVERYKASEDGFRVMSITGFDGRTYSQDGAVGISRVSHVVDIDEWQMLVRYNDSTLRAVEEKRGKVDLADTERFIFTLSDDLGHVYTEYRFLTAKTSRHNYLRLVFDGVPLAFSGEETGEDGQTRATVSRVREMQLNVYCREDVREGEYPASPMYHVYVYAGNAAQYDYKNLKNELPGETPTEGLRSSSELFRKDTEQ